MRTYCNPLNLPYQYQHYGTGAHREAADPTLVFFKDRYYLFASMSGGFYHSNDLLHWEYHKNPNLDLYRYAPDVRIVDGSLIFCASTRGKASTFWKTDDPLSDRFEKVSEPFDFWDPNVFQDEDGRVYFYWGCDCGKPIYAQELNRRTLEPIGEKKEVIFGDEREHGWERCVYPGAEEQKNSLGMEILYFLMKLSGHGGKNISYIEGAFMNKWRGKYYLQYAAPMTQSATYGDGVYIGDSPLGPFKYQNHNPFSLKPGGFITGAGHGSTIEDTYGNLWHASTMRISVNANFERRVGLFPAGLDEDGILFCNQNFADYPLEIPEGKFDPMSIGPKWMLLSYKKKVETSSAIEGHPAIYAVDENIRTSWCAAGSSGEWITVDLGEVFKIGAIQINLADVEVPAQKVEKELRSDFATNQRWIDLDERRRTRWLLEGSCDGENWEMICDKRLAESDLSHDYLELQEGQSYRYLKLTAAELPYGQKFAVSGFRVFGKGRMEAPEKVEDFSAEKVDDLTVRLKWKGADRAHGYNVRYGTAPDKLYLSHMVYDAREVLLTALNRNQTYYFAVDSFGEGGVTVGTTRMPSPGASVQE